MSHCNGVTSPQVSRLSPAGSRGNCRDRRGSKVLGDAQLTDIRANNGRPHLNFKGGL